MTRVFLSVAVVLCISIGPTLAGQVSDNPETKSSVPSTQPGATPEAAKSAKEPATGSADTSGGAAEQSSAPPGSDAATVEKYTPSATNGRPDTSGGAMERSSAPPASSAADPSKPSPILGGGDMTGQEGPAGAQKAETPGAEEKETPSAGMTDQNIAERVAKIVQEVMSQMSHGRMDRGMGSRAMGMTGHGMMGHGAMRMRVMMILLDTDGDRALSLEEVQTAHARIFKAIDADKDGKVTMDEIQKFLGDGFSACER